MNKFTTILIRLLIIALAVLATAALMVWVIHWPQAVVLPGAITSGVLVAILMILGQQGIV